MSQVEAYARALDRVQEAALAAVFAHTRKGPKPTTPERPNQS